MPKFVSNILLLVASNTFMNAAWYGRLKFKSAPLWIAILASWGIAASCPWLQSRTRMVLPRIS